jgi:adenylate cyclase
MTVHRSLSYLSFGRESDGAYCHAARDAAGKLTIRELVREPDGKLSLTDFDRAGSELTPILHEADKEENDPRKRGYYTAALEKAHATWTETYIFFGMAGALDIPGVTYATPITAGGQRLGVMTADFDLRALSQLLATLRVVQHGYAFVVEDRSDGTRRVIAHPDPALLTRPAAGGGREAVEASTIADKRIGALLAKMPASGGEVPVTFEADGTKYVGAFRPLAQRGDLTWSIGVIVPENDILGEVNATIRFQVLVGVIAVAIAIILALFVAALVAGPLRSIAREAKAVGRMELEPKQSGARVSEVAMLGEAVEDMKASLRSFRKFVPSDIVRMLLVSGKEAMRGGERRTLTIFFSDLEGFTSVAEQLPPETLVLLLGEYLEAMTDQILASGGTVDKYIGDAIMAFWNAPSSVADHALRGCTIALTNQRRLAELRESWRERGLPAFKVRIGLNTGEAFVGNIGSEARLDYTAIGDSVNLASRLEGLNKYFGTDIMISASTYTLVAGAAGRSVPGEAVRRGPPARARARARGRRRRVLRDGLGPRDRRLSPGARAAARRQAGDDADRALRGAPDDPAWPRLGWCLSDVRQVIPSVDRARKSHLHRGGARGRR